MSIRQRLTLGTFFLFLLLLLSAGLGIAQLGRLSRDAQVILKDNYETARYVQEMQRAIQLEQWEAFEVALRKQEENITEVGEREATAGIRRAYTDRLTDSTAIQRMQEGLQVILDLNLDAIERKNAAAMDTAEQARLWLWGIAALVLVVGLTFSLGFPRLITQPIERLRHAVEEVAQGNYRHRVPTFRSDELGALSEAFNTMAARLEQWESSNLARVMTEKLRVEAVLNSLEDAGIGVDPDGVVLFVNRKAAELLGLSADEITGKRAADLAAHNDLLSRIMGIQGGTPFRAVVDGREQFFAEVRATIEGPSGSLGTVHFLRNITPFQERDQAKTMFLATISHELKTPLASSDIGLGLLERKHSNVLDEEARGILTDLRKDHQRLVRIVSELLDMAQMESGRFTPKLAVARTEEVVSNAIDAVGTQSKANGVRVVHANTAVVPTVVADTDKLILVLINLLSNALRYSPAGGTVTVSARLSDGKVQLMVEDEGPGVDAAMEQRIFEPYSTRGSERRSGLGLAISRQFMRSMGGDLELDRSYASGARFVISCRIADGSTGT